MKTILLLLITLMFIPIISNGQDSITSINKDTIHIDKPTINKKVFKQISILATGQILLVVGVITSNPLLIAVGSGIIVVEIIILNQDKNGISKLGSNLSKHNKHT